MASNQNNYEAEFGIIQRNTARVNQLCNELDSMKNVIGQSTYNASTRSLLTSKEKEATKLVKNTMEEINNIPLNAISNQAKMRLEGLQTTFQRSFERLRVILNVIKVRMQEEQSKLAVQASMTRSQGAPDSDQDQLLMAQHEQTQELAISLQEQADMRSLEQDMLELNTIMQKFSTMVHEQGQMVDDIEANIEHTYTHVEAGNEQLITAVRHRNSRRKKCIVCWCILAVALLILCIVLAIKFAPRSSRKSISI
ncbi:Syntaxin-7 [Cichlidogyrus casuarinus]|uniref:Syntaxin-7 n=1 Tax=Cichlidogyrus casuarinus TaxID=1844966 RepID=A0ABD2PR40_9PLAT